LTDLLRACAELVDIPSVSHDEAAITDHVEERLRAAPWLTVERVGNSVVARTQGQRAQRLVLAGHTDTVAANGNAGARIDGDVLWGLGSADMKSGVAVLLDLALTVAEPGVDVTYVFYECEEVESRYNGLVKLLAERPELLDGDAAVLCEPTGAHIEAGCQGTLHLKITLKGARAHTARPWMGRNAVHRLGRLLDRVAAFEERCPVIDGCEFREALQAVKVEGGVAGNVVPDSASVVINHRFAPDRTGEEAQAAVLLLLGDTVDTDGGDTVELVQLAAPAPPSLDHPLLGAIAERSGQAPQAKLGWTDVSFFAAHGVPATNYGPGDPNLAHTADERVDRADLERVHSVLKSLVEQGI
jgi:succinyl-diaminopimelate desuccinylase